MTFDLQAMPRRPRFPRIRLRGMLAALAVLTLATAAAVRWSDVPRQRALCLASAREYRGYEARIRFQSQAYEACAARHPDTRQTPGSCPACDVGWDGMRTLDGRVVRSAAEAAVALRQAAELCARLAERFERGAATPWSKLRPLPPADRDAWEVLTRGHGPLSQKFFTVL